MRDWGGYNKVGGRIKPTCCNPSLVDVYYLVHSECSAVSLCTIWCTLPALVFARVILGAAIALVLACVLLDAFGLLWCWSVYCLAHTASCELQMFDQEAIVETTNERTAIDSIADAK